MKKTKELWFILILIFVLIVSFGFTGCAASDSTENGTDGSAGSSGESGDLPGILSEFETTTLTGEAVDSSLLEGYDLTMVNVWATFCGPCINEMPDIAKIAEEYRDQGVQILGIVSDVMARDGSMDPDQVALAEDIVKETGAGTYTHLMGNGSLSGLLSQIYAVPTTFFVDGEGNQVGKAYVQMLTEDQFRTIIDETLGLVNGSAGEAEVQ